MTDMIALLQQANLNQQAGKPIKTMDNEKQG